MLQGMAHDESGALVPTTEFDYDAVDQDLFDIRPESDLTELTPQEMEAALKGLRVLLQWTWQSGMKNPDGVKIRAIIMCWIFLKELRPLTLTQLARGYGLKKQSLGRWVDDFKVKFPEARTVHMRDSKS
jgi:hypothetical protein